MTPSIIPPHGGYRNLQSFRKSEIVYDATVYFCRRFLSKRDRTYDQMVQAARSGKQNIVEGSAASGTSKEMELKLTNVARASLEELVNDYRDFLRAQGADEWHRNHPHALRLRALAGDPNASYQSLGKAIEHADPAICSNVILGLTKLTCYLLDQQIRRLEADFIKHGGLRERMTQARLQHRRKR